MGYCLGVFRIVDQNANDNIDIHYLPLTSVLGQDVDQTYTVQLSHSPIPSVVVISSLWHQVSYLDGIQTPLVEQTTVSFLVCVYPSLHLM